MNLKVTALALFALFLASIITIIPASALSPITFTTTDTATSQNQQFRRVYENGTSSVIMLDSNNSGTYYSENYNVSSQTVTSDSTTVMSGGDVTDSDAYPSNVDQDRFSVSFDGSAGTYGTVADDATLQPASFCVSAWANLGDNSGIKSIMTKNYALTRSSFQLYVDGDDLTFTVLDDDGSTEYTAVYANSVSASTYHLVMGCYDQSTTTLSTYVDNVTGGTASAAGNTGILYSAGEFLIGATLYNGGYVSLYAGRMDEPRLYSAVLDSSQRAALYSGAGAAPTANLQLFLPFNDGYGTTAYDMSGNGNNASLLVNTAWSSIYPTQSVSNWWLFTIGRDSGTGNLVLGKLNLSDLSTTSAASQASSYHPRDIVQTTDTLYSPLYNITATGNGVIQLGSITRAFGSYSEAVTLHTGNSTVPARALMASQDTGTTVNDLSADASDNQVVAEKFISTAAMNGKSADGILLSLRKINSPTGTATIGTFDGSGNVITTFATINVASIATSQTSYYFQFNSPYTIQTNDRIGIKYTGGDTTNYIITYSQGGDPYDGTNAYLSTYKAAAWTDTTSSDLRFVLLYSHMQSVVYDGSPDTIYTFFESGTDTIRAVKRTGSTTLLGTAFSHTTGEPFSVMQLTDRIILQTATTTYQILTASDAVSTLFSNSFNTRYPQSYSISPASQSFNTVDIYQADSTEAYLYDPATGASVQTQVLIDTTTAPTLGAYDPSRYYRLMQNDITIEASAGSTTWTIKDVGAQTDFVVTPYSEQIGTSLMQNSTLFGEGVLHLNCDSGVYTVAIPYFATGDDSDCTLWRITEDSTETVGREVFNPYARTVDLVHAPVFTGYTFIVNVGDPTIYYIKSLYDGKVVDVAEFDSGFTATQHYLYGQCYQVQVINENTGNSALIGSICANDVTQKNINIDSITVPTNWQGRSWSWNLERDFSNSTNNSIIFTVEKDETPFDANIHIVNNLYQNSTVNQWFNFTGQVAPIILSQSGYFSNNTLWITVYDNASQIVVRTVSAGKAFDLQDFTLAFGPVMGISMMGFFVVMIAGIFPRSMGTIAIIAVLATAGIMWTLGWLDDMPVIMWPGLIGLAVIGIISDRHRS